MIPKMNFKERINYLLEKYDPNYQVYALTSSVGNTTGNFPKQTYLDEYN